MNPSIEHFPGCHPEDAENPAPPEVSRDAIPDTEPCWHCGTPTTRGCHCWDCQPEDDEDIPAGAIYHCPVCKRWWAYMTGLNITTISFNQPEATP